MYPASILLYILTLLVLNTDGISVILQPEANQLIFHMLGIGRWWLVIALVPLAAILPDFVLLTFKFIFRPNPDDEIMQSTKSKNKKITNKLRARC